MKILRLPLSNKQNALWQFEIMPNNWFIFKYTSKPENLTISRNPKILKKVNNVSNLKTSITIPLTTTPVSIWTALPVSSLAFVVIGPLDDIKHLNIYLKKYYFMCKSVHHCNKIHGTGQSIYKQQKFIPHSPGGQQIQQQVLYMVRVSLWVHATPLKVVNAAYTGQKKQMYASSSLCIEEIIYPGQNLHCLITPRVWPHLLMPLHLALGLNKRWG